MKKMIVISSLLIGGCTAKHIGTVPPPAAGSISVNGKLFATVFQQKAAEYKALCFQAFNVARWQLDQYKPTTTKPKAIITDIDETVLDNSPYEAHQTLKGKDYEPSSWYEWTAMGSADTVPGAPSFLKYAASKGIEIFYITNRMERERESTLRNLQKFNFPNADNSHFFPKLDTSSKESRRMKLADTHEVVMLLGDNLADFSNFFDKRTQQERDQNTERFASEFGSRFIIIPNTSYGDWEGALYKGKRLTEAQKDSVIRAEVKTY